MLSVHSRRPAVLRALTLLAVTPAMPSPVARRPDAPRVQTSAVLVPAAAAGAHVLVVTLRHAPGVHTWPGRPVPVAGLRGFEPVLTRVMVRVTTPGVRVGAPTWPEPQDVHVTLAERPVVMKALVGAVQVSIPLQAEVQASRIGGRVAVSYQPCDEQLCYPPRADTLDFSSARR